MRARTRLLPSMILLCASVALSGCGAETRTVYTTPHEFDPQLEGLQRLWAQNVEQQLAAGLPLNAHNLPANITPAATVVSATGAYRGFLTPDPAEAAGGRRLTFELTLSDKDNNTLQDVQVALAGGMPLHSHGLPTEPQLQHIGNSKYQVRGLMFTMPGWWQLAVGVSNPNTGTFDMLVFNFFVSP